MEVEMTIRGLMMDPVSNMPIVILKDARRRDGIADLVWASMRRMRLRWRWRKYRRRVR